MRLQDCHFLWLCHHWYLPLSSSPLLLSIPIGGDITMSTHFTLQVNACSSGQQVSSIITPIERSPSPASSSPVVPSCLVVVPSPLPPLCHCHGGGNMAVSTHSTLQARAHSGGGWVLGCCLTSLLLDAGTVSTIHPMSRSS